MTISNPPRHYENVVSNRVVAKARWLLGTRTTAWELEGLLMPDFEAPRHATYGPLPSPIGLTRNTMAAAIRAYLLHPLDVESPWLQNGEEDETDYEDEALALIASMPEIRDPS